MINLNLNIRKSDIGSLWSILGTKWIPVRKNKKTKSNIESFWAVNETLSNGRINSILNAYNKMVQTNSFTIFDFIEIEKVKEIKYKGKISQYNYEYKLFFRDIYITKGSSVSYLLPPTYFTNTLVPPEFLKVLGEGRIYNLNEKKKKITLIKGSPIDNFDFYGYIFIDEKKNPFRITSQVGNIIYYEELIAKTIPKIGSIKLVDKYELKNEENFKVEIFKDFVKFKFKKFEVLDTLQNKKVNVFDTENSFFAPQVFVVDNFIANTFGMPIGLTKEHIDTLSENNLTPIQIDEIIFKLWRLNQRPYGFQQFFRLGSILSGEPISLSLSEPEIIYNIDIPARKIKTAKLKAEMIATATKIASTSLTLSESLFSNQNDLTIFKLENPFNTFGLLSGDIIIDGEESYVIKRIFGSKYIEVDRVISSSNSLRKIKILSSTTKREYSVNDYGFEEQFDDTKNLAHKVDIQIVRWGGGLQWGNFIWGDHNRPDVNPLCQFPIPKIGDEKFFGDSFSQTLLVDFAEGNINPRIVQKYLALQNKEFSKYNGDNVNKKRTLLIAPFLNYGEKYLFNPDTINSDEGWTLSAGTTSEIIEHTDYIFTHSNIKFDQKGDYIKYGIDLGLNNSTGISLLKFFVRKTKGSIKIGINPDASFLTTTNKKKFVSINDNDQWIYINLFIDRAEMNQDNNYIFIEAFDDETEIDIFGVEYWNSIPSYFEKLKNNKKILEDLTKSNDFQIINLI